MKLSTVPSISSSLSLLLLMGSSSVVQSFQLIAPPTTTAGINIINGNSAAPTAAVVKPSSFALYSTTNDDPLGNTADSNDENSKDIVAELENARQQLANSTSSLDQAKQQQNEMRETANLLREERENAFSESDSIIDRLKRSFMEEITDLSDQIEGAQDTLRKTFSNTKSQISSIQEDANINKALLKDQISQLESRQTTLRQDAATCARERDSLNKSIKKDAQQIKTALQKERDSVKSTAFEEKKELTRERYALESRIQQAELDISSNPSIVRELQDETRRVEPKLSALKQKLLEMKRKMMPRVDELKEKRAAKEMFFDASLKSMKDESKEELELAKSVSEEELLVEDQLLENATASFELQLVANEKELARSIELSNEAVELSSGSFGAISGQQQTMAALLQEKLNAISTQENTSAKAMQETMESHSAIQDEYDAKYENSQRNLNEQESRSKRRLENEDERRSSRKSQLTWEMEELTSKLSLLMKDEGEAAKLDYQTMENTKTTQLANSASRVMKTKNEIQTMRSNLIFVQGELKRLEDTSQEKQLVLEELEEERMSFRKQARRTVSVAFGRITRRGRKRTAE
eukprot:CAMPEP_0172303364 /NCGR_PEP_ID=MMETSP1058-20130122/4898_1 /TAXON_ID=83371 /ORGANISM="Detonula confervacea, Strain CCMP 353" /LENGTH=582 /DNA_ID=CAMNT_0013014147 /DNA_START=32 /DNA_END=1780 /DNA_ORIENTATION=+